MTSVRTFFLCDCSYSIATKQFHLLKTVTNFKMILIQSINGLNSNFNINKYVVMKCSTYFNSVATISIIIRTLECVKHHAYLAWSQTMSFSPHIENIVSRASKILNFIKCDLYKRSTSMKSTAYISLVHCYVC